MDVLNNTGWKRRKNTQKPNDELYSTFKQTFTELGSNVSAALPADNPGVAMDDPLGIPITLAGAQEDAIADPEIQRGLNDQWKLTPSVMDPNSLAFSSFANQLPGYYAPTPGGANTLYQSQAGDLHTPHMAMNMVNPLSGGLTVDPTVDMGHMHTQLAPQHFHHLDPFAQAPSFAPSTFVHHDPIYEPMDHTSMDGISGHVNPSLGIVTNGAGLGDRMDHISGNENFRYHVTLRAPTAMVKHADEIPITYLNKGQAYTISVVDTAPLPPHPQPIKYRTYVRVSFEDEQQRAKPAACWQLWKEGRGSNEAHQRGGRLLAVEYVDPNQGGDDGNRHPQVTLENASFDGFCVTWSPNPSTGSLSRDISVRFNFLSTDFSHSKGVKGIPVRLCTKTELISPGSIDTTLSERSEVCYCKVKLFRDHGAERKLSNDIAHVRKSMDKLKQQIAQVELGAGNFGKRKRTGSFAKSDGSGKITKHKRSGSSDSQAESSGRMSVKEDLQMKLSTMQDMFSSARPASILNLSGDEQDDPDLFPVCLSQEIQQDGRLDPRSQSHFIETPSATPNILSPTASSNSINSPGRSSERHQPQFGNGAFSSRHDSMDWSSISRRGSETHLALNSQKSLLNHPVKVEKASTDGSPSTDKWFEAVGVDSSYTPPSDRPPRAVACFYVRFRAGGNDNDGYYRAVYLSQRTARDLVDRISEKCQIDPTRIIRAVRIQNGRKIMVDDDVVRQLPEGQDMVVEISGANNRSPLMPKDVDMTGTEYPTPPSVELKLIF
ncbi:hypothetical protein FQN54_007210 [Arachnomyces sp. PD_36]|nr:hypothetical protein FQN54_007210 [Arachnomyces sp. PD_36]